ncbi:hypothetical protein SO802_030917 [Lithocarpus litseifolius]|uniref:Transmembrane protein n=1 Tax=Lithocarpus litseifolius TaxID=425828 RepID=A0AAW2BIR7_9ROSI
MRDERGFCFLEGGSSSSSSMSSFVAVVSSLCSVEVLSFVGVDLTGDLSSEDGEYGLVVVVVVFWGSVALLRFGGGGGGKNLAVVAVGMGVANSVGAIVGVGLVESSSSSPL